MDTAFHKTALKKWGWLVVLATILNFSGLLGLGAAEASFKVQKVFHKPFQGNQLIGAMAQFGGQLYVAAGNFNGPGVLRIYRADHLGCQLWEDVTPAWQWGSQPSASFCSMAVLGQYLYLFTNDGYNYCYRTSTGNSNDWQPYQAPVVGVPGIITGVFDGHLYTTDGLGPIYRTADGTTWTKFADYPPVNPIPGTYNAPDIECMAWLNNELYVGVSFDANNGIDIWKTNGSGPWVLVKSLRQPVDSEEDPEIPGHVHAMKAFNEYLYIGRYLHTQGSAPKFGGIYRTNGTPGSWELIPVFKSDTNVIALEVSGGLLFAGAFNFYSGVPVGTPLLSYSSDGKLWTPSGFNSDGQGKGIPFRSLASHDGRIYAGTFDDADGGEIFEVGKQVSWCKIKDLPFTLVEYIYGWMGVTKNRLLAEATQAGAGGQNWSREILADLGAALANLRVDNQGLKREAQAALQRVVQDMDGMISFVQLANDTEGWEERQSYLEEAREYLLSAQEGFRVFTRMVAQLAEQPDPFLFRDSFTFFSSEFEVWRASGFYKETATLGEPALFTEAGWLELLRPPFLGRTLFSFRAKLDLFEPSEQYLEVTLGDLKEFRYQLLVDLTEARLVRRPAGGKEEELARIPITWDRWRLFQVERGKQDLRILWDGRELMKAEMGAGELALKPEFNVNLVKYSSDWWLDDVEVIRLP